MTTLAKAPVASGESAGPDCIAPSESSNRDARSAQTAATAPRCPADIPKWSMCGSRARCLSLPASRSLSGPWQYGFDIDWEWHYLSDDTTQAQFKTTFSAVGPALRAAGMLLTMCPATTSNLDAETVNEHFDIIAFQMYSSTSLPGDFVTLGIHPDAFAYGAKFEAAQQSTPTGPGVQTATQAFQQMQTYGFKTVTTWRLNSENYITEQDSQLALSKLVKGVGPLNH